MNKNDLYRKFIFHDKIIKKEKINSYYYNNCYKIEISQPKATFLMKEICFENENNLIEEIKLVKFKMNLNNYYLLKLIDYSSHKVNNFCSTYYYINIFYEYPSINIKNKTYELKKNNKTFCEEDLIHIIYQISLSCCYLQTKNMYHGILAPEFIGIFEKEATTKLIDSLENENKIKDPLSLTKKRILNKKNIYCSPLFFQLIFNSYNKSKNYDKYKEDVFSLGLIILELGLLNSIQDIYCFNTEKFDFIKLKLYIKAFEKKYQESLSPFKILNKLLKKLLEIDQENRLGFKGILEFLPPYDQFIEYFKEKSLLNVSNTFDLHDFTMFQNKFKPATLAEPKGKNLNHLDVYKNNPETRVYFDEDYDRYYYYNIWTHECEWIYTPEEKKKLKII